MDDTVPPQPITAAIASLGEHHDVNLWLTAAEGTVGGLLARKDILTRAVVAAAPHLAAAEREACAQLAEQHHAHYGCYVAINGKQTSGLRPFADLLRGAGEGGGT